jgi:hypothetical protein
MKWSSRDFSSHSSAEDEGRIIVEDRVMDGDVLDGPQPLIGSRMIALFSAGIWNIGHIFAEFRFARGRRRMNRNSGLHVDGWPLAKRAWEDGSKVSSSDES